MLKTLSTLAVCMTVGAGLLGWLEPTPQDYASGRSLLTDQANAALRRGLARELVRTAHLQPAAWGGIEVVALGGPATGRGTMLSARTPPDGIHFLVLPDGRFQALPAWRNSRAVGDSTPVIRIGLSVDSTARRVPPAQWAALQALLVELVDQTRSGPRALPVQLSDADASRGPTTEALLEHLRSLLSREGLLG